MADTRNGAAGSVCPSLERHIHKFVRVRPRYEACAAVLGDVLRGAAASLAPLAIVQGRTKSLAGFAEKIHRKGKYRDPLSEITDLCGVRIIVQTSEEVDAIGRFIERHFVVDAENSVDVRERLKPTEFGYRSVHYVVQFRPGVFPAQGISVRVPPSLFPDARAPMKAEVQVRTLLEHAWADFGHDRSYKCAFRLPTRWERELAMMAAMLEQIDRSFAGIHKGLLAYASSHGSYMTAAEMRSEAEFLECVLKHDPGNVRIAHRLGRVAMSQGLWPQAVRTLSRFEAVQDAPVLRDLGVSLCKVHRNRPSGRSYRRGQRCLEQACRLAPDDGDALASLAGTWRGLDDVRARELYHQAYELDPSDPYALGNYMEHEIRAQGSPAILDALRPMIQRAADRCRSQIEVAMNLPWAYFDLGKFSLISGRGGESLTAYAKALQLSTSPDMVDTSLRSLEALDGLKSAPAALRAAIDLLRLGRTCRFGAAETAGSASGRFALIVLSDHDAAAWRSVGPGVLRDFEGTLALVGDGPAVRALARYARRRHTGRVRLREFSARPGTDPAGVELKAWAWLAKAGARMANLRVLGAGGDERSALHLRIALALGATVAVLPSTGGACARLAEDPDWRRSENLLPLPDDPWTVRSFLDVHDQPWTPEVRQALGRVIHEEYQRAQIQGEVRRHPSMAGWDDLRDDLRSSNLRQADHIRRKLREIGCAVRKVSARPVAQMTFTREEVELMAEMEHARWTMERLLDGWRWGPRKDVARRISAFLVSWHELPESAREWDRHTVRRIPQYLAALDMEVFRQPRRGVTRAP